MSESKVIRKIFWIWDWDMEEKWLNRMSHQGWHLSRVGICRYEFEKGQPDAYQYRLQALKRWPQHEESQEYIEFVESTGAELVDTYMYWAYFRQSSELGAFELFSDNTSRIRHLQRIQAVMFALLPLLLINLVNMVNLLIRYQDAWLILPFLAFYLVFTPLLVYGLMRTHNVLQRLRDKQDLHE